MQRKTIPLAPVAVRNVSNTLRLIQQREEELTLLKMGLEHLIEQHTGVNLHRQHYLLDQEHWTLVLQPPHKAPAKE